MNERGSDNFLLLAPGDSYKAGLREPFITNRGPFPAPPVKLREGMTIKTHGGLHGPTVVHFAGGRLLTLFPHTTIRIDHIAPAPVAANVLPHRAMRFAAAGQGTGSSGSGSGSGSSSATITTGSLLSSGGPVTNPPVPQVVIKTKNTATLSNGETITFLEYLQDLRERLIVFAGNPLITKSNGHGPVSVNAGQMAIVSASGQTTVRPAPGAMGR